MKPKAISGSAMFDTPPKKTTSTRFNDVRFVNYSLPDSVKTSLKEKPFTSEQVCKAISDLLDAGYKVTIKDDSYTGGYQVFLSVTDPKHVNAGMILPGRGSTWEKALKQACFIHYEVTDCHWEQFLEKRVDPFDD